MACEETLQPPLSSKLQTDVPHSHRTSDRPIDDDARNSAPLTLMERVAYACGGAGWVVVDRLLLTWALYFYMPPDGAGLPTRLPTWTVFGAVTLWGVISIGGRVIDSVTDPIMANLTDQSRHPFGRRRIFMAMGAIPLAMVTALVFSPPDATATWTNALFVGAVLTSFYLLFTVYNVPYAALLPELGRTSDGTLKLSVLQSGGQLGAAALVMVGAPVLLGVLKDADKSDAFMTMGVLFSAIAAVLMMTPVIAIDEPRLVKRAPPSSDSVVDSLKAIMSQRDLRWFLVGAVTYWFGFNTVAQGVPYYVTVLMGKDESYAAVVLAGTFAVTAVVFPFVPKLSARFGKARVMVVGALFQAVLMVGIAFIRDPNIGVPLMALAGIPVALVMAVPNAILSDLARRDAETSGKRREAMIFAAQAFFLKVNLGVSAAVLAGLLTLGASVDNPLGVQLSGPVAAVVLLVSAFAFARVHRLTKESGAQVGSSTTA